MRERSVLGLMPRRSAAPFLPWITQLVSPSARWICALSLSSKVARRGSSGLSVAPLGKVAKWDATFYIAGQFVGGALGATAASLVLSPWVAHASVNYVITAPGDAGTLVAFGAEVVITFILMTVILHVSNNPKLHKLTGLCAGALVATYITVEAPISGMSMNPACAVASAIAGNIGRPSGFTSQRRCGMLSAAEVYMRRRGASGVACAKLHHENAKRCIFCGKPAV